MGMKKDEFVSECSDIDDIIVFRKDGKMLVTKISDKVFVGKGIEYAGVFRKTDDRMVYHVIYLDGKTGTSYVKRFQVSGITRDKEYDLTKGNKGSKLLYFSANPNGESEILSVQLSQSCKARQKKYDYDMADLAIKGRGAQGNIFTKYPVRKVLFKEAGKSTLGGFEVWYNKEIGRLNLDGNGKSLGTFYGDDLILSINKDGSYELGKYELTNRYDIGKVLFIERFREDMVVSSVYQEGVSKTYFVKRFKVETQTLDKKFPFISEEEGSRLIFVTTRLNPKVKVVFLKSSKQFGEEVEINLEELIDVKGWKAQGNKFPHQEIKGLEYIGGEKYEDEIVEEGEASITENENKSEEKPKTDTSSGLSAGDSVELEVKKPKKEGENDDQLGLFE